MTISMAKLTAFHRVDFIRSIDYTETFQRDEEDDLTEEEIREIEEILKVERATRGAQGQQDEIARKSDEEYRMANAELLRLSRQAEMQIEAVKLMEHLGGSRHVPAPLTPLNALSQVPMPTAQVSAKTPAPSAKTSAPLPPRPPPAPPSRHQGFVAPLSPTVAGRTKSGPDAPPRVTGKGKDAPPTRTPSAANKASTAVVQSSKKPGTPSSLQPPQRDGTPRSAPLAQDNATPSSTQPVPKIGPLTIPAAKNKFDLKISSLPRLSGDSGKSYSNKGASDNSGSSDAGGAKKASVGTLKLQG